MDGLIAVVIFLFVVAGIIVLIVLLSKSGKRKAENKALSALQPLLVPGEQLIEFTRVNTKGASATTVMLTGAIGAAISRSGGMDLFVGLTNRFMRLTPVNQNENSQSVQMIPVAEILRFEFESGLYSNSTMKVITRQGEMTLYVSSGQAWIRRALSMQRAFLNLQAQQPVIPTEVNQQPAEWRPIQQTQLVSVEDTRSALQKEAKGGRNSMIAGGIFFVLGLFLTAFSQGQVLFWGAILFGAIAFFVGLSKYSKARNKISNLPN